jgi:hypothetical protein
VHQTAEHACAGEINKLRRHAEVCAPRTLKEAAM